MDKILCTAEAVVEGGRAGHDRSVDGRLDVALSVPQERGGDSGSRPEHGCIAARRFPCLEQW
jgi:organic hydroperoxide reductase OsmC/OhrA